MKPRFVMKGWVFATVMLCASVVSADGTACFEDIEQNYEWDDQGFNWSALPLGRCPGESQPASPLERKWGGSAQIRASGLDAIVIEETYAWVPIRSEQPTCLPLFRTVTRTTRIAKNGVLYQTTQTDDKPPQQSQRPMKPNEMIYITNIQSVPPRDTPYTQRLGSDTIAGQPCQKIAVKAPVSGAAGTTMCVFLAPEKHCPAARYLQPLELTITAPGGQVMTHGRTTLLRYGGRGTVVSTDSIKAP